MFVPLVRILSSDTVTPKYQSHLPPPTRHNLALNSTRSSRQQSRVTSHMHLCRRSYTILILALNITLCLAMERYVGIQARLPEQHAVISPYITSNSNGYHVGTISDEFDRNQLAAESMTRSYHLSRCVSHQYIATTGAASSERRPLQRESPMQDSGIQQLEMVSRSHDAQQAGSLSSGTFAHNGWSLRQKFNR